MERRYVQFWIQCYIDNLLGIKNKYNSNTKNPVKLSNKNKFKLYDLHHPTIKDKPIKIPWI